MIIETATIAVIAGKELEFEAAVREAVACFREAAGCRSMKLERCIEEPSRYFLVVGWDRIEDHLVTFRESAGFQRWRALASPFFETPPSVEHSEVAVQGF